MSNVRLYLLGPPRLEQNNEVQTVDTRKAIALLAYVAITGSNHTRETLASLLWPEYEPANARAALRRTLSALRRAGAESVLEISRELVGPLPGSLLWVDVEAFGQLLDNCEQHGHAPGQVCDLCQAPLQAAIDLCQDEFMTGFTLRDSPAFDEWQYFQRESLRARLAGALERLAQLYGRRGEYETAVPLIRRWLALDTLREEAHRALMQLYAWSGQQEAALRQYRECVRILDEELGVAPLPETTALYQAILDERESQPVPPAVLFPPPARPTPYPLIGRAAELERMQQLYRQVGPDGRLLVIEGEPGIGKTRTAETFLGWAAARGAAALAARCYEGETRLAYAPIMQALRDQATAAQIDTLPPHYLAAAARLLPELAAGRALSQLPALSAPGEQVRFYEAVAALLDARLRGPRPGLLWMDDVHWLDMASQELLLYLLRRWRRRPYLVLLCWRPEDLPAGSPLPALAADLRRAAAAETIRLTRFTTGELDALLAAAGLVYAPDFPTRLMAETEGLPFFVVEYLNAAGRGEMTLTAETSLLTPATVRDLLCRRLDQVGEMERQILQTAAAIGRGFDLDIAQMASGRSPEETVTALETLVARGLLVEPTVASTGSGEAAYNFSHDKLRALVYEEMGLARRRLLHRRLAETLAARRARPAASLSAKIAAHYQLAGLEAEAAVHFVRAGDQARALYAHHDAIRYYRSALALGAADGWRLHAACGELYTRLGAYPDALAAYETAAALAPPAELGRLEQELARVYQRQGNWALAAQTLAQVERRLGDDAAPAALAWLAIDRSLVAHRQRQAERALTLAEEARALAESAGDQAALAQAYNILGLLARHQGELDAAVAYLKQSRQLAERHGRLDIEAAARNNLALTLSAAGQLAAARENLEQALALCRRLGDRHHEAALRSNLADVLRQAGKLSAAEEQVRQSATIYAEIGREEEKWRAEIWQLVEW